MDYSIPEGQLGALFIYDILGKQRLFKALDFGKQTITLNGALLPPGVYFYKVLINGETKLNERFVLIK